jgi:ATP-dependent Clp protease protease subunit
VRKTKIIKKIFNEAIPFHETTTTDDPWDSGANVKNLPNTCTAEDLRQLYAWVDPAGNPDAKASYKFPHHMVSDAGTIGAANTHACSSGIGVLNGGMGGTSIPDTDVQGVYDHLAKHLKDAGLVPPELQKSMSKIKPRGSSKRFWSFRADEGSKSADLLLYGEIASSTWWGDEVTPKQFHADLDALGAIDTLNVYMNSPGGDVFAAQAIYTMLKRHSARVNVYVDGLAASGASLVAMAGDTVYMPENAMMMIHNPWTFCCGNANDLRKEADAMDKIRESMIVAYQSKCGLDDEAIINIMDAETWLTADDALALGFCDEIEEEKQVAASLTDGCLSLNGQVVDLSRFKNLGKVAPWIKQALEKQEQEQIDSQKQARDVYLREISL